MATKIRLQRHGKKGRPFYHVVIADSRAKRDGKLIEKIGTYDPTTNPATIDLNLDSAVKWLQNGAQPTDTCRALLSYKGAIYKNHLLNGVRKGALTEEQVEAKFSKWLEEKEAKVQAKVDKLAKDAQSKANERFKVESEYRKNKEQEQEAKLNPPAPEAEAAPVAEETAAVEGEVKEETPVAVAETASAEEPKAEAKTEEEKPAEEEKSAE